MVDLCRSSIYFGRVGGRGIVCLSAFTHSMQIEICLSNVGKIGAPYLDRWSGGPAKRPVAAPSCSDRAALQKAGNRTNTLVIVTLSLRSERVSLQAFVA